MALPALGWDDFLSIVIPLLAAAPFWIALNAYVRTRTVRVLFFTAAFGVLFLKGVFVAAEVLVWEGNPTLDALEIVADAAVLVLFTLGMMKG